MRRGGELKGGQAAVLAVIGGTVRRVGTGEKLTRPAAEALLAGGNDVREVGGGPAAEGGGGAGGRVEGGMGGQGQLEREGEGREGYGF